MNLDNIQEDKKSYIKKSIIKSMMM
ncbi:hypothetical protein Godav_003632 [Gossypium davidsonii]|uniref:Uncharacterized protein n=1 Tax=Gossypium davidsonii TaxID=34287 RepID=A0A7J8SJ07_GOSDV|nr:hypothetical protein [Gossypium davidsonii]